MGSEDMQNTPDLDAMMMEGHPVFDGEAVAPEASDHPGPAAGEEEKAGGAGAEETSTPDEKKPAVPAASGTEQAQPAPSDYRFTSHEEAERGYRELQRLTTGKDERLKALERENAELKGAEARKQAQAQADEEFVAFAAQRREQALQEIDELDPDDPEYRKKVGQAWGRADLDIRRAGASVPAGASAPATSREDATGAAPDGQEGTADEEDARERAVTDIRKKAGEVLTAAGLDPADELFWAYASVTPDRDSEGNPIPLDEQIRAALEKTQNYRAGVAGAAAGSRETTERARAEQQRDMPMGRAGAGVRAAGSEEAKPVSLDDALAAARNRSRYSGS